MKRIYWVVLCFILILELTGCSENNTDEIQSSSIPNSMATANLKPAASTTELETTGSEFSETEKMTDILDFGDDRFTIESPVLPWTEEDVTEAWNMVFMSKDYTRYFDCIFCDLNDDGIVELILTAGEFNLKMFVFEKTNDEIKYKWEDNEKIWEFPYYDADIGNGVVCTPIVSEEKLTELIDSVDENWTGNTVEWDFKILEDTDGNKYMTGLVRKSFASKFAGKCFWVKQITVEDDYLATNTLYRWGVFWELQEGNVGFQSVVRYYKCNGEDYDDCIQVTEEEVENFLMQLL